MCMSLYINAYVHLCMMDMFISSNFFVYVYVYICAMIYIYKGAIDGSRSTGWYINI
jgi:hypothetical protein